jgi:phosphoglycerate dehydrogenase-like enzyme
MPKVLVTAREAAHFADRFRDVLEAAGFELAFPDTDRPGQLTGDQLAAALGGIEATVAGAEPYTPRVFAANPQFRVVARVGVGYDAVDTAAATAHGVAVTTAPGTNHGSVAEHAFALMLGFTRHIPARHAGLAAGGWPRFMSRPLRGQTLGLAGLGRIGKAVATRATAFEMRVIAYEPVPDRAFCDSCGVTLVSFEQLLAESDFLSLHLPLTAATRYLMYRDTLAKMKPTAVLVNTSRGGLVCEADLVDALRRQVIAGAALDVFEHEPTPQDNPLRALPNVVLTPHAAGVDEQSIADMARSAAEAIVSLRRGEWPAEKVVNPEVRAAFRW